MLFEVIHALGEKCSGRNKLMHIPFRNSKLTLLLEQGLSGKGRCNTVRGESARACRYYSISTGMQTGDPPAVQILTPVTLYIASKNVLYTFCRNLLHETPGGGPLAALRHQDLPRKGATHASESSSRSPSIADKKPDGFHG